MTTSKSVMLIKVSANENNNKFYEVQLHTDGSIRKRWGRVGTSGTTAQDRGGEQVFERIVRSKKGRGYKEVNIARSEQPNSATNLSQAAQASLLADPSLKDPKIQELVARLVKNNKHQITKTSGGLIEIDDSGVIKTPLGIIDESNVHSARKVLLNLKDKSPASPTYVSKLEEYLSLIPQKVAHRRGWHEDFLAGENFQAQFNFLDQLEQSYAWYEQTLKAKKETKTEEAPEDLFQYKINQLENTKTFSELQKFYQDSVNTRHKSSRFKLEYVYQLQHSSDTDSFAQKSQELGNVQLLWHGTNVANILSILSKGLFVPSTKNTSIHVTGRMFGDGVYFSNQSTKSLNYSTGYWDGNRSNKGYLFLADVALGKEYHPTRPGRHTEIRKSHDSIYVKPHSAGVLNNEVIVWDTDQIRLKYLCEFSL